MPIPAPNFEPPFNILRLSHVELVVTDLTASRAFYVDTLGLQVTAEDSERIYLRAMEERGHHCVVLKKGGSAEVGELAFKVFDESHLEQGAAWFESKGLPVQWVERPFQSKTFITRDPHGIPLEFYARMDRLEPIHQKYALYKGVKPLRIDHFNCFRSGNLWAAWTHRKDGVHDIAFTNGRGPRLHHLAFWVPTPLNIIDLLDLMSTTGYVANIERGPGRHGISNAFFLYILDPDGHRTEIYCSDYQTIDPDHEAIRWDLKDPQRQTLWGAAAPKSWFEHGTHFQGAEVRDADLTASPIIAP